MTPLSKAVDLISSGGTSVALGEALTAPDDHRARRFNSSRSFRSRRALVLFLYGLIVGQESAANFVPANTADDILAPLFLAVRGDPVGTAGDLSVSSARDDRGDARFRRTQPPLNALPRLRLHRIGRSSPQE
jgi:hypothetical protein